MMKTDHEILRVIQDGVPITREPFKEAAEELGMTQEELVKRVKTMNENGLIRRFSANINQRKLGITANAVVVWNIPEEKMEAAVPVFLERGEISHIYERRVYPGRWEYNLYTVVHDYDRESVERFAKKIADEIGVDDYQVLFSKRRFKGTSSRLATRK
jgi:DNA-binding Lrp family transcriptional regulator